ncbi:hypothetical protein FOL47_005440 [Perkinsus chesapeaki]|uniref:Cytochrome P450-dit2 n=1 Tax=Perkinsus chesapeaki TaxID=330153 RepID=A0A7J6MYP8_PERCH|nr:hypothetical protein FOL47_005440 [Perkinsus chesapeaki]
MLGRLRRGQEGYQFNEWAAVYGPVYSFRFLFSKATVLSGIAEIKQVLKARPQDYSRRFRVKRAFTGVGAHGLFSSEGEEWRELRRITAPAFNDKRVKEQAAPIVREAVEELVEKWRGQGSNRGPRQIDTVQEDLNKLTLDIICRLTLGRDLGFQKGANGSVQEDIRLAIDEDLPRLLRDRLPWGKMWPFNRLWSIYGQIAARAERNGKVLGDCVLDRKVAIASLPPAKVPNDLLQVLIHRFSLSDTNASLKGNLLTYLAAGSETTAGTASYLLWYLAKYPEVQDRLRKELRSSSGSFLDREDFPFLHACVMETLRLSPAVYSLVLETVHSGVVLCEKTLPKGSVVVCNIYGAMVLEYGTDFRPDRWLSPDSKVRKDLLEGTDLLTFGFGPRVCVGKQLAIAELAVMAAAIITQYELSLSDDSSGELKTVASAILWVNTAGTTTTWAIETAHVGYSLRCALYWIWDFLATPQVIFLALATCYFAMWRVLTAQANAKEAAGRKKDEEHVRLVCGGVNRPELAEYCEELNGDLFPPVGIKNVLQCAISKNYIPMGKAYSPLEFQLHEGSNESSNRDLVWSTPAVTINRHPPATKHHANNRDLVLLFENVSKLSGMSAMDALILARQGGRCSFRDLSVGWTLGSDYDRFLAVDLYNNEDFFAVYEDSNCFKRIASWSLEDMAKAIFKLDPPTQIDITVVAGVRDKPYQLKNMNTDFVHALALVTCYTSPRRERRRYRATRRNSFQKLGSRILHHASASWAAAALASVMESAINWCLTTCRCPWAFGSDYYTNLDSDEDSGRLDRRALLGGHAPATNQQPSTSSEPRYRIRTVPKPVSPRKAEECPTVATHDIIEALVPANEVLERSEDAMDDPAPRDTAQESQPTTAEKESVDDEQVVDPSPIVPAPQAGNGKRRRRRKKRPQKDT